MRLQTQGSVSLFFQLYNAIISDFAAFVSSGDLSYEIVFYAVNRVPPIPELWNALTETSFSTSGSYTDPFNDPNGAIAATSVTTTGTLSVDGLPTLTTSSEQEASTYFETAIVDALDAQGLLPDGASVAITGFNNGQVEYEVTFSSTSEADAAAVVSNINASLSQSATLSSITSVVQTESSGGTLSMTSLSVNSNTAGTSTQSEAIVATSTGQLTTSLDTTGFSTAETEEVKTYFQDAITETLDVSLPEGSFVTVTGIDSSGVVSYEITMYSDPSTDLGSMVSSFDETLVQSLTDIQDKVTDDSTGVIEATSVSTSGELSVSGLSITTAGELTEATNYFETAITDTLTVQGILPDGAVVTVTGFSSGTVEYEIIISAESSTGASQAVSQINTSLSQTATLSTITTAVQTESSGGTLSVTSLSVNSNSPGTSTENTVSKVTSTGQLTTSVSTSGLTSTEIDEVATFFKASITSELASQGVLPASSYVTVTGFDSSGVVSYVITMFNDPAVDSGAIVSSIDLALSQSLASIQAAVQTSSSSGSASVVAALSTTTISSFASGHTTGITNTGSVATALSMITVSGFTAGTTSGKAMFHFYCRNYYEYI